MLGRMILAFASKYIGSAQMNDSVRQYKRQAQVIVGKAGVGLSVTELRITFEVVKNIKSAPNTAIIKIFNLHPDNEAKIKKEYDDVILNAGYEGGVLLLFRGNITHVYRYREGNDFITEINAADGDTDFRLATVNGTLAAGTTNAQLIDLAVASFAGGTTRGVVQVPEKVRIRGKVVTGNTRDLLDTAARDAGANWSIQDGQLTIVGVNSVIPGVAIVLTSETGLLGAPETNDKGIAATCLLNPQIKINSAIKLDNNSIKAKHEQEKALGKAKEKAKPPVRLDPDGIYKVIKVTHKGDNRGRGPDWTSEVTCVGLDEPIPADTTPSAVTSGSDQ